MCVLIAKPAGHDVPEAYLRHSNDRNAHGIGMSWIQDGRIRTWKNANNKRIDAACEVASRLTQFPAIIHFRYATHGIRNRRNCHPFFTDERRTVSVAHNGMVRIKKAEFNRLFDFAKPEAWSDPVFVAEMLRSMPTDTLGYSDPYSDTRLFVERFLTGLADGWWKDEEACSAVESLLEGDRMAVLSLEDHDVFLLNKKKFTEENGVWYSNTAYKPYTSTYSTPNKRASGGKATSDDLSYEEWHTRHYSGYTPPPGSAKEVADTSTVNTLDVPVDPFAPVDKDDFLVAYYVYKSSKQAQATYCNDCCPDDVKNDEALCVGLFFSDMSHLWSQSCDKCKKEITVLAEEMIQNREAVSREVDATEAPVGGSSSRPVSTKSLEAVVGTIPPEEQDDTAAAALRMACQRIREYGVDPDSITIAEASERFPDLFTSRALVLTQ